MATKARVREQHLAVFGASGSGKTVLISSFYGAAQEQSFVKDSLFNVIAEDTGQGNRLRQNYLGMKNSATLPSLTRFSTTPYSFLIKLKNAGDPKFAKGRQFDALRLVWHDYPGEWFEEDPSSDEEARRRIETFRSLLRSDVALILVDGQKLLDHAGEEERYLKSLFWGLRDGLERLKDDILDEGQPLKEFPRIWIIALSKADLHPGLDAHRFQDLVIEKAANEVSALHEVLKEFVRLPEALSVGEDFLRVSSAKFEPGRIEVSRRVGLDLLLPVAALLPLERLARWDARLQIPRRLLDQLVHNSDSITKFMRDPTLLLVLRRIPRFGKPLSLALPTLAKVIAVGTPKVRTLNAEARAKGDYVTAVLTQFRLDLDRGVEEGVLIKSLR
jgi:hypothetical protein